MAVGRPVIAGGYRADEAQRRATAFTIRPHTLCKVRPGTALWEQVTHYLQVGYSPEQIAGTLSAVHPDYPTLQDSHETIYTAIYADPCVGIRATPIAEAMVALVLIDHALRNRGQNGDVVCGTVKIR